jgi:hypothetical protein
VNKLVAIVGLSGELIGLAVVLGKLGRSTIIKIKFVTDSRLGRYKEGDITYYYRDYIFKSLGKLLAPKKL